MPKPRTRRQAGAEPAQLYRPSEELQAWAGMLGAELTSWPQVRAKAMFGMVAFYRGRKIFAALPRTRALNSPHSISFKFNTASAAVRRARRRLGPFPFGGWASFELHTEKDLSQALDWLDLAYRSAK
jgi:hypothetical protein